MTFTAPQVVAILIITIGTLCECALHGRQPTRVYTWYGALFKAALTVAFLGWGGFWK